MKKIYLLLVLCFSVNLFSQDYKFGKVSKAELEEKFYPLDATADAAYLYRKRRTYYDYVTNSGFQIVTNVHERIKIYTKEGFEKATKFISYYKPDSGDDESVNSIKGYTFYLNKGNIVKEKLSKKSIFTEKTNKYRSRKKITMPSIKEGVVIELKYTLSSPYYGVDDLQFQYNIPVKTLDYKIEIPEYYKYNKRNKGYYTVFAKESSKNGRLGNLNYRINVSSFQATDIPALKDNEPFVSNIENYRGGITYELSYTDFVHIGGEQKYYTTTWEDVSKQVYKYTSFGGELNKSNFFKDDLTSVIESATNEREKLMSVFQHVKSKIKWNGNAGITARNGIKKAYKEGAGNSGDINLLLTAMLREAGLDANPVLVSTRNNGVPFFPTINGFNYVVSMVEFSDESYVLLDATEPYSVPNILPKRALNWKGRKVTRSGTSSWVNLTSKKHALEENNIVVSITEDKEVHGILRTRYSNINALNFRNKNNHLKEEDISKQLEEKHAIEIENFKISNKKNIFKPISLSVKFNSEDLIEEINEKLYIEPLLFFTEHTNPFKLEDRKFPVDFGTSWKDKNTVTIEIPKGYKVASLPTSIAIGLPENIGVFKYKINQVGNKIQTISVLEFNQEIITSQYYEFLKGFYGQVVAKQSEKIVLVKE